jgi:hypothetical protein
MPKLEIYGKASDVLVKKIKNTKNTKYMGVITNSTKAKTISKYKFNLIFSKSEGMPTTIFETLSYGIPTIAKWNNINFNDILLHEYVIKKISEVQEVFLIPTNMNRLEVIQKQYTKEK